MRSPRTILLVGFVVACSGTDAPPTDDGCDTGHCDLPTDPAEVSCTLRRSDAFNDNRLAFNHDFLRWSCADVAGVTADDRGQEYCEYFAIAKLPSQSDAVVLGKNLGRDSSYGTTPEAAELTPAQISALEADDTAVVGQCVFTSWNSDIAGTCTGADCPAVLGVPVDESTFRMTFDVNSADAAQKLVEDCLTIPPAGDPDNRKDLRHDDFFRGCLWNAEINQTEYRKSDTTICSAMTRSAECGCAVTTGEKLGELISPLAKRGFPLGGWQDTKTLPANCRYVELGDDSQTVVTCDLTAGDLLYGAADVKAYCADKYADSIVVHVPVPADKLACDASASESPYAATCTSTPWVLSDGAKGN